MRRAYYGICKQSSEMALIATHGQSRMSAVWRPSASYGFAKIRESVANQLGLRMGQRVLVVDDDDAIIHFVTTALTAHGFEVAAAPNAREALRMAARDSPDVILLDIMMPGMDGTGVLAELRRKESFDATRVVMMSARDAPRDIQESSRIGADAYITKPFSIQTLVDSCGKAKKRS
jgi:CheY-like chemotaxis protein